MAEALNNGNDAGAQGQPNGRLTSFIAALIALTVLLLFAAVAM
jgi:hypothetical protein